MSRPPAAVAHSPEAQRARSLTIFFFLRPLTIKDTLLFPSLAGSCSSSQYWLAGSSVLSTQQACLHNIPGLRGVLAALFTEDMEAARVTQLVKGRLRFPPFRQ